MKNQNKINIYSILQELSTNYAQPIKYLDQIKLIWEYIANLEQENKELKSCIDKTKS